MLLHPHTLTLGSAERNAKHSHLLRLPPELRNRIWEYALSCDYITIFMHRHPQTGTRMARGSVVTYQAGHRPSPALSLPRTCRQIHAETCTLVFRYNYVWVESITSLNRYTFRAAFGGGLQKLELPHDMLEWDAYFDHRTKQPSFLIEPEPFKPHFTRLFYNLKSLRLHVDLAKGLWLWHRKAALARDITLQNELRIYGVVGTLRLWQKQTFDPFRELLERRVREREGKLELRFTWVVGDGYQTIPGITS